PRLPGVTPWRFLQEACRENDPSHTTLGSHRPPWARRDPGLPLSTTRAPTDDGHCERDGPVPISGSLESSSGDAHLRPAGPCTEEEILPSRRGLDRRSSRQRPFRFCEGVRLGNAGGYGDPSTASAKHRRNRDSGLGDDDHPYLSSS